MYSTIAEATMKDESLPAVQREKKVEEYRQRALRHLRRAHTRRLFTSAGNAEWYFEADTLDFLRDDPEFQKIVEESVAFFAPVETDVPSPTTD